MQKAVVLNALFAAVILVVFGFSPSVMIAQAEATPSGDTAIKDSDTTNYGPSDSKEFESFLDELMDEWMEKVHIPGLVFVLVKDGDVFLAKGYGYADLEKKKAVIPDKTLFQVGSISKLLTATAVMQLYERGLLQLDTDVNTYLRSFQLDEDYPQPVTAANLLTHSAGFRGGAIGSSIRNESEVIPLKDYVATKKIPRAMPTECVINYSNYGFDLAGFLVEEISGMPFAEYIDRNILKPLGMEHSSFYLKPDQAPELARSYTFENGNFAIIPYTYPRCWPAPCGSLTGTATDMACFMIAHLQNGRYGDNRILNTETARMMHQQHFTNHPRLPGTCYGFYEYYGNNLRAIFHDGDISGFSGRLFLMPDQNLGFFVCYNGGPSAFRMQLTTAFLNRYYPAKDQPAAPQSPTDFGKRAEHLAGSYRSVMQDIRSLDKLRSITELIDITSSDSGLIWTNNQSRWVEVEPLLFQYTEGKTPQMAFRENSEGAITHLFLDFQQIPIAYEKVAWYDAPLFTWSSLGFFSAVFLSSLVVWPIMGRKRSQRKQTAGSRQSHRLPRLLAVAAVILNLVFLIGLALFMLLFAEVLVYGVPLVFQALLIIPMVTTVLTAALLIFNLPIWIRGYWSRFERWHYSLVTLTCTALVFWCYNWNLLGFHY